MAKEDTETLAEMSLSLSFDGDQSKTLAEKNKGRASAMDMLLELGKDYNEVKNCDCVGSSIGGDNEIENGGSNMIKNIEDFRIMGTTIKGLNLNTSFSVDDELVVQSQMIETKDAVDEISVPSDMGVLCKNAKKCGPFDNKGSFDDDDDVILGLDFSENNLEKKVDKKSISLVEISNDEYLGKCDGVECDRERKYSIGDFVWSKFNSHPWWPAQIYDPSDASDHAKKCIQWGKPFLVVYFGDGSFSWRSSSQLKPFAENFDDLSKQNDSKLFLTAVQSALDEIGRVAKLKMTCHFKSDEEKAGFIRKAMINVGIKKGVTGPECDFGRLPFSDFGTLKLYSNLSNIAVGKFDQSMLSMTWLRSCLSAFYSGRGGRDLVTYNEVKIEGMEMYGLSSGKDEFQLQKCATRKRKSVAKLMKENAIVKAKSENEITINDSSENGSDEDEEKSLDETSGGNFVEENEQMISSRKRKKSRYLCYPYTNTITSFKGSKRDLLADSVKISKFTQSPPILEKKLVGKSDNGGDTSARSGPSSQEHEKKKMIEPNKFKASPEEVITKVRSAAVYHQSLLGLDSCDIVIDFIHAYRSVVFVKSLTYKPLSKERKSLTSKLELDQNETHDESITMLDLKGVRVKKNKKANKIMNEVTNSKGLLLVKKKLEKVIKLVGNCDCDMFPGVKLILENEMHGVLEEISAMLDTRSS